MPADAFQPTSPEFLANPYPFYKELRETAPIFFYEPWGKWVLTRYEDVNALLTRPPLGTRARERARGKFTHRFRP